MSLVSDLTVIMNGLTGYNQTHLLVEFEMSRNYFQVFAKAAADWVIPKILHRARKRKEADKTEAIHVANQ